MRRLTIKLVKEIYNATGVNILLLTPDEWRKANPVAQRMLINAYLKEAGKSPETDGVHIEDNFDGLLAEAITYFFTLLTTPESGKEKK